ncbi:MAG: (Fe-S)-binding protein [Candidatus Melainabacteria bacterium]|nr:(Fe-S)-binding protein [Candidatus Melainabacteria bacterium]
METRGLWWNVHDFPFYKEIFYTLFFISLIFFVFGFYLKIKNWKRGKPKNNFDNIPKRFLNMFLGSFLHKGWGKNKVVILAHILVFYGFFVLWIGTDILTVQERLPEYFFEGLFYKAYSFVMDMFGLLMLVGLFIFAYIRNVQKPKRLDNFQKDWIQLTYLIWFVILGFLIEGIRQSATNQIEPYAPVGATVAIIARNLPYEIQRQIHTILWWLHSIQTFSFVALIPYTKFSHIFIAPANLFFVDSKPRGALSTPFNLVELMSMDNPPDDFAQTVTKLEDFSWKDLMDLDACTGCGKCQELCPATNSEKPLSPKWIILDLKQVMYNKPLFPHQYKGNGNEAEGKKQEARVNLTELVSPETLWSCTSCGACVESCPVGIDQLTKIIDLRRTLIADNEAPNNLINTLKNIRSRSNPWGQPVEDREKWADGLDIPKAESTKEFEYLYWVGCAGAYDSRNQNISKTMARLLKKANVNFAILGKKEKCTGDTARRAGDEGLFQELAIENIATMKNYNVKKIVTHCPHCFNTFKNEYPEFGLTEVEVFHHTEVLWELIKAGQLTMTKEIKEEITFHDSCYLGRHNGKYDAPRNILNKIPGIKYIEMKNSKEHGTCCGGGGAQLWYEAPGKQINVMRLNEIKDSGAKTAASACPFCTIMLETARTLDNKENPPSVKDISELVESSI